MIEEVIFFASVAWFSWKGFRSGVPRMLLGFGILLSCYITTWLFSKDLAKVLVDDYNFSFLKNSYIVAALAIFFGCYFILGTSVSLISKISGRITYIDASVRGAILGSVFGAVIGLFLSWAGGVMVASIAQKQNVTQLTPGAASKPGPIEKISTKAVNKAVETAIKTATPEADDRIVEVSAALITNPVQVTGQINNLVSNEDFNKMMSNPAILAAMNKQDSKALASHPEFRQLAQSPDVQRLTGSLGLAGGEVGEQEFAESMVSAWSRVQAVRNTPKFQKLMQDPEVRQVLMSQNPMNIISNPKANELLKVILNPEGGNNPHLQQQIDATIESLENAPQGTLGQPEAQIQESQLPVTQEYWRWRDEKGRYHFSEQKPEGVDAELIDY